MASLVRVYQGLTNVVVHTIAPTNLTYSLGEGFTVGARVQRRQVAESPFLPRRKLIGAVDDISEHIVPIIVKANGAALLQTRIDSIVDVFTQFEFNLEYIHDSGVAGGDAVYMWQCEKADWSIGESGEINNTFWHGIYWQVVRFSVPITKVLLGPL